MNHQLSSLTRTLGGWLGVALLVLPGCGTFKQYRLPVPGYAARGTFLPLAGCATQQHLESVEHQDALNVRYDPETWIQYMIQGDAFNMVIIVGKGIPEPQRESHAMAAKQKGDELFACATQPPPPPPPMGMMPGGPGQPDGNLAGAMQNMAAATMNMGAATMNMGAAAMNQGAAAMNQGAAAASPGAPGPVSGDPCARLVACYSILARDFCQPGTQCQFKAEVKGNDPRGCQSALQQVPSTVQMLSMARPGYQLPETCR